MKKMMLLALATLAIAGQANAQARALRAEGRDPRANETAARDAAKDAARAVSPVAGRADVATKAIQTIERSNLARLSPSQMRDIQTMAANDSEVQTALAEIAGDANKPELRELTAARYEGLSNLKGISANKNKNAVAQLDPVARAEQTYRIVVLKAGRQARTWSASERGNVTFLVADANTNIARGMKQGQALLKGVDDLKKEKGITMNPDDARIGCDD